MAPQYTALPVSLSAGLLQQGDVLFSIFLFMLQVFLEDFELREVVSTSTTTKLAIPRAIVRDLVIRLRSV